jgi:hypothetical protein
MDNIMREIKDFPNYKLALSGIPTRNKLKDMLNYDKIDARKLYYTEDEIKLAISKLINNFNFFVLGKTEFIHHEFKIFDTSFKDKKPTYSNCLR